MVEREETIREGKEKSTNLKQTFDAVRERERERERERRKESRELFCRCVTHLVELSSTSSQVLERGERRKIFHIHDSLKKNLEIEAKISLQQGVL